MRQDLEPTEARAERCALQRVTCRCGSGERCGRIGREAKKPGYSGDHGEDVWVARKMGPCYCMDEAEG